MNTISTVPSDNADPMEPIRERLVSMQGGHWLRAVRLAEDADLESRQNLTAGSVRARGSIEIMPRALEMPKVERFVAEQEFVGFVLSVDVDERIFWTRLVDKTNALPDEEAEFSFNEITADDWKLIIPGAIFSWNIGLEWRDGQTRRVSDVRFRRFYRFSKSAIARADAKAEQLVTLIAEINEQAAGDASVGQ